MARQNDRNILCSSSAGNSNCLFLLRMSEMLIQLRGYFLEVVVLFVLRLALHITVFATDAAPTEAVAFSS